jgi:hypothetical protein
LVVDVEGIRWLVASGAKLSYIGGRASLLSGLAPRHDRLKPCPRGVGTSSLVAARPGYKRAAADGRRAGEGESTGLPSLFRFLVMIGFLVGVVYATMFALVTFVEPQPREISVRVPAERLQP